MASSLQSILPFLKPFSAWLQDETVSEIMVNPNRSVYVEQKGIRRKVDSIADPHALAMGVKTIARQIHRDFGEHQPMLDARLKDGSRICATWPTVALGECVSLNIRKFQSFLTLDELVGSGSLPFAVLSVLREALLTRRNILISGSVSSGKTTLLRQLVTLIPAEQRIITIEDTAELDIRSHDCLVKLEAKVEQRDAEGKITCPAVSMRDLVKDAMRKSGDRLILGEVRGAEAFDLLKALNSGSSGSLCSIHADSAELALEKLAIYVLEANTGLPMPAIYRNIGLSIHYVLQQQRRADGSRGVAELVEVDRYDEAAQSFRTRSLYART